MKKTANLLNSNKKLKIGLCVILLYGLSFPPAAALTYTIPLLGNTVGAYKEISANSGDTLEELAEEYDIGVFEMREANPHLKNKEIIRGTKIVIPSQFRLPSGPRTGIVLNLADKRLFYYHPNEAQVSTYPVGIGRQGWSTPLGTTQIISKEKNPAWHPPASIRQEAEMHGKTLPLVVPAGPRNPLGQYAMHLGFPGILMHGTNNPASVGLSSSHGCIRMYADDIKSLFFMVPIGTSVRVVSEPH